MKSASHRFLIPLTTALLAGCLLPLRAAATSKDSWLGIYLAGRKVGYAHSQEESATFQGKPALKLTTTSSVQIDLMGSKVSQESDCITWTDTSYAPLRQEYRISSNGSMLKLDADYQPGKIVCAVDSGGGPARRVVPVPPGTNLATDSSSLLQGKALAVGYKTTFYCLDPLTIALDKTDVEVKAREAVTLGGAAYDAYRVEANTPMGRLLSWETADGDVVKGEMSLGLEMYRLSREQALDASAAAPAFTVAGAARPAMGTGAGGFTPPADFALATAVKTDKPIPSPRTAHQLSLSISGVANKSLALSDERQQVSAVPEENDTYRVVVHASLFNPDRAATLPIKSAALAPYQRPAPYLETDAPAIKRLAARLKGKETNAYRVAGTIRDWVHANMTPDATIGVPRSCTEILGRRKGVCRDYATLYAGIARAAGIPTRVVAGIVYSDGRFFYHAWAESWVGKWVAMDPTMSGRFVDATHIKFAQGDVTDMYRASEIIGRIKVNVVSAQ